MDVRTFFLLAGLLVLTVIAVRWVFDVVQLGTSIRLPQGGDEIRLLAAQAAENSDFDRLAACAAALGGDAMVGARGLLALPLMRIDEDQTLTELARQWKAYEDDQEPERLLIISQLTRMLHACAQK